MKDMISFYEYAKQFKNEYSARGDLARDMIADKAFPRKSSDYRRGLGYLIRRGACSDSISIFKIMFNEYAKSELLFENAILH